MWDLLLIATAAAAVAAIPAAPRAMYSVWNQSARILDEGPRCSPGVALGVVYGHRAVWVPGWRVHEYVMINDALRSRFSAWFLTILGDEEEIGGRLSAGKGFVHVSSEGDVEPYRPS